MNPVIAIPISNIGKKISPNKIFENPQVSFKARTNKLPNTANIRIRNISINMVFSPFLKSYEHKQKSVLYSTQMIA